MNFKLNSLGVKLTLSFLLLIGFVTVLMFALTLTHTKNALKEVVRSELTAVSQLMSLELSGADADAMKKMQAGDEKTAAYDRIRAKLKKFQSVHPDIKYIYTMKKTGAELQFIVDPMYGDPHDPGAGIGEKYADATPWMVAGFENISTEENYSSDKWGQLLSSYAPVCDSKGERIGLVGVDMSAATVIRKQNFIGLTIYLIAGIAVALAAAMIFAFSATIIKDIHQLQRVANDISQGKTSVEITVVRQDEIGELARSFRRMVASLKIMMPPKTPQPEGLSPTSRSTTGVPGKPRTQKKKISGSEFAMTNPLAEQIHLTCVEYFGPAALEFLKRQTVTHMGGLDFEQITPPDLPKLLHWILISGRFIINAQADELVKTLEDQLHVKATMKVKA